MIVPEEEPIRYVRCRGEELVRDLQRAVFQAFRYDERRALLFNDVLPRLVLIGTGESNAD